MAEFEVEERLRSWISRLEDYARDDRASLQSGDQMEAQKRSDSWRFGGEKEMSYDRSGIKLFRSSRRRGN